MSVFFVAYIKHVTDSDGVERDVLQGLGPRETRAECEKLILEKGWTDVGPDGDLLQPSAACVIECDE